MFPPYIGAQMSLFKGILRLLAILMLTYVFTVCYVLPARITIGSSLLDTMSAKDIAKIFLSPDEIEDIMRAKQIKAPKDLGVETIKVIPKPSTHVQAEIKCDFKQVSSSPDIFVLKVPRDLNVKLVVCPKTRGRGMHASEFAKVNNALAAINAGGFDDPNGGGSGRVPVGLVVANGKIYNKTNAAKYNIIAINRDGNLKLGFFSLEEIRQLNIESAVEFGPILVYNGEPQIQNKFGSSLQPRTAIGQTKDGNIIFVVADGRRADSLGATYYDIQQVLLNEGAVYAANLDGGSSSTLYYAGSVRNKPSGRYGERSLPNAFIITE